MASVIEPLLISAGFDGSGVARGMAQMESRLASGVERIVSQIFAPLADKLSFSGLLDNFTRTADGLGKLFPVLIAR